MGRYAASTQVSPEKSRAEIERTLSRYGATSFGYGWDDDEGQRRAVIMFRYAKRQIRFLIPMPSREQFRYTEARGYERNDAAIDREFERACRQRWRALALAVKAKLEMVDAELVTFEEEFLPYTVLPSGQTLAEVVGPQIDQLILEGRMPTTNLLTAGTVSVEAEVVDAEVDDG